MQNIIRKTLISTLLVFFSAVTLADYENAAIAQLVIKKSGTTPAKAFELVNKAFPGLIYEYDLEMQDVGLVYEIRTINPDNNKKHTAYVNLSTGQIQSAREYASNTWFEKSYHKAVIDKAVKVKFPLDKAISMVLDKYHGFVIDGEIQAKKNVDYYSIELITENGKEKFLVDIEDQEIVPVVK
ncbi:Uncharacterised protein [BD1-7 clade bacterium]|uniref:PepSY domain-containing protein n=1 Tax=BD1-7 clade bacterium TaxID=2029982 RepID=A0A5S9N3J8_9GAMM|nr:Uncharacterised protein [BD1-7 clade bacterium]